MVILSSFLLLSLQQVAMTEFQADNDTILEDQDGERVDWIELHNFGTVGVDLGGWFLSDDDAQLTQWAFPTPTLIQPGAYLLVFASDKDRAVAGEELHLNFKLDADGEYLALIRPDGLTVHQEFAPAFPAQYENSSFGLAYQPLISSDLVYFQTPTPGAANGGGGPVITQLDFQPSVVQPGQDITVIAQMADLTDAMEVELRYRVGYQPLAWMPMYDDGSHGDVIAHDQSWTAIIPGGSAGSGEMIRWVAYATDVEGGTGHYPAFHDKKDSAEYSGTMVVDPSLQSDLPIYHWFVEAPSKANTWAGTQASVYFDGEFYDNIKVRKRGGSSSTWSKKSYKFDFNRGAHFRFDEAYGKAEEFNLNTTWSDKSYLRRILCWESYHAAGLPASVSFPIHLRQNGEFFALTTFVEQVDKHMLKRFGWDDDSLGALYKMFNVLDKSARGVEKKTRLHEKHADLKELVQGLKLIDAEQREFVFDHVDIPAVVNYLAVTNLIHNNDHIAKNYYVYRDSEGDLQWQFLAWDLDLTLGRNYTLSGGVLNDTIWADDDPYSHPNFGDRDHPKNDGPWNRLIDAIFQHPEIHELFARRLRTVMDELLQPPGTPRSERWMEQRMDFWAALMQPEVTLDVQKWGIPAYWDTQQDFAAARQILEQEYLEVRRTHFYQTHGPAGSGLIPEVQPIAAHVGFASWDSNPSSGLQAEEFIELMNLEEQAIDISGWQLQGDVQFTFEPGTVIGSSNHLYVSPDLVAFRNRLESPHGQESLLVVGPYDDELPTQPDLILLDANGDLVATTAAGPQLVMRNFVAGQQATLSVVGATPGGTQLMAYSLTGSGPSQSPWGMLDLSTPIHNLPTMPADGLGMATLQATLPIYSAGQSVWLQSVDLTSGELSSGLHCVVQP